MIASMTGHGDVRGQLPDGRPLSVEVRTVNSRYLKTQLKLPEGFTALEPRIERQLRDAIVRGSVHYNLRVEPLSHTGASVNWELAGAYLADVARMAESLTPANRVNGLNLTIDLVRLLGLPGVVVSGDESPVPDSDEVWPAVEAANATALARLGQMRREEGRHLWADLQGHCEVMTAALAAVRTRLGSVSVQYAQRLRDRVQTLLAELGSSLGEHELVREVAIYAERCDMTEEMARLAGHIRQFVALGRSEGGLDDSAFGSSHAAPLKLDTAIGRRLDFLSQEMLREANTMSSKAHDGELLNHIILIKAAVDRIKEQVQNIE